MTQEIYQKQFSIGRILSESWKMFIENFQVILIITLVVYIPINIILSLVPIDDSMEGFKLYLRIMQILEGLIGIIATMAIAYAIKNKLEGKVVNAAEALKKALSRWGAAVGTNIMLGIFLLGLTLLLIVPGIIYYVYWIFVSLVVVLNDKSGKDALDYSKKIVEGRWWRVAGYSIVFAMLGIIVGVVVSIPYWFLPENFLINIVTDTLIDILFSFFIVALTIFFINFDATKKPDEIVQG